MNEKFEQLSLMAGGSHYPTINPDLQQRFGESIVQQICEIVIKAIDTAIDANNQELAQSLQTVHDQILAEFGLWPETDDDWDAAAELQKIFDEFDLTQLTNDKK
jgi:hypothetical protein